MDITTHAFIYNVLYNLHYFSMHFHPFSYGTGDFLLGELLELVSRGDWEFVWAQEWFTMTDQLNMGVRRLMMDPVYFWGKMRLCHCGTTFKWVDKVLQFLEKVEYDVFVYVYAYIKF